MSSSSPSGLESCLSLLAPHELSKAMKLACRAALLSGDVRVVEKKLRCDLQCNSSQLGNLYATLAKMRGEVIKEDIVEGTELFSITALLPVTEAQGFSAALLKKTSGAATTPQLSLSHWETLERDPFWRPTTAEEREEEGEEHTIVGNDHNVARKLIDAVRRRKGLPVEEKIVVAAEKQRTLSRAK